VPLQGLLQRDDLLLQRLDPEAGRLVVRRVVAGAELRVARAAVAIVRAAAAEGLAGGDGGAPGARRVHAGARDELPGVHAPERVGALREGAVRVQLLHEQRLHD